MGFGKTAVACILRSVWRAGVWWGPASIPAVSLGLVVGLTWMDGGALARQHLSAGLTRHRCFPQPPGLQGKSQITQVGATGSLVEMAVLHEWLLSDYWGQINKCLPVVLLSLGKLKVEMPPEECAPGMSITRSVL